MKFSPNRDAVTLGLTAAVFLLLVGWPVFASETDPADSSVVDEQSEDGQDSVDEQPEEIYDEIVVTGGLIADSVQDTPESVAVWNADTLTDAGARELRDVFNQTANAYPIANGEGFGIRGINHTSVGTGGIGELGSYYVDGVALTGLAKRVGPTQLWDVEQVEILRGPQTTNVVRIALAGAIVLATKAPVLYNESRWRFGLADEATWEAAGMINVPINDNSAFRFTVESWNSDGFVTNPTLGEDDFDARETLTLRGKYLYQSESDSNFSLLLSAQYGETSRGNDNIDLAFGGDRINASNIDALVENETLVLSADMRWDLSDAWALRSITSILDSDYFQTGDNDTGPDGGNSFSTRDSVDENWAQDIRFEYAGEDSRGVFGLYYTEVDVTGLTFGQVNVTSRELGVPDLLLPFYPASVGITLDTPFDIVTSNFALFGHWDWKISDRWSAFAGLRWDREELDVFESVTTVPAAESVAQLPNPAFFPPPLNAFIAAVNDALLSQAGTTVNDTETDYDALLPEAGVSYAVNENLTASLFYKQGYRAGGAAVTLVGRFNEYDPETLDLVEFSLRSLALDKRLSLNTNIYAGRWTDQQVSVQQSASTFDFLTINAGESEIYGFEVDFAYRPMAAWDVYGSLGFAHTEFTDFQSDQQGDLTGNRFALAPEWTAALGFNYRFTDGWFVHGDVSYQSDAFARVQNDPDLMADERTIVNFRGGYETARYSILGFIENATDELYLLTAFEGGPSGRLGTYGNPRQAGVQVILRY
ncbi:MAG: TonB-dependent receptor [Acidobacteriota bacterium]